jgi:hypothetical protein
VAEAGLSEFGTGVDRANSAATPACLQAIGLGLQCVGEEIPQLDHINRCVLGAGDTRIALCLVAISDSRRCGRAAI